MGTRKQSYGLAAAKLRACMETGIKLKKAEEYFTFILNMFEIGHRRNYETLLEMLQNEDNIQLLAESIANRIDAEELFPFAKAFLDIKTYKNKNEGMQQVFMGLVNKALDGEKNVLPDTNNATQDVGSTQTEIKEEKALHIFDCEIKTYTFHDMQSFQYIQVPKEDFEELEADFSIGEHLKVLTEISESNEADNGNLMLICESKETGLIAMKYLSCLL